MNGRLCRLLKSKSQRYSGFSAIFLLFIALTQPAQAIPVTGALLEWDSSSDPTVSGCTIYRGTKSGIYDWSVQVNTGSTASISNFVGGKLYYFVVKAFNSIGVESEPSNEVQLSVPENHAPVGSALGVVVIGASPGKITLAATDADGDPLTFAISRSVLNGTLSGTPPNLIYRPNRGFSGRDSFSFTANDGYLTSQPATFSIIVQPDNPPTTSEQSLTFGSIGIWPITLSGSDPDGDPITYKLLRQPRSGTLSGVAPNFMYTPKPGFSGNDGFTYTVSDGIYDSPSVVVDILVKPNRAPVGTPANLTALPNTPVRITLSGSDPDGNPITFKLVAGPSKGKLSGTPPLLVYTPNLNATGKDSFLFTVSDALTASSPTVVAISLDAPSNVASDKQPVKRKATAATLGARQPPVAIAQSRTVKRDQFLPLTLSGNVLDGSSVTFSILRAPEHGVLSGAGSELTYLPFSSFVGSDSVEFTVADAHMTSASASISISVQDDGSTQVQSATEPGAGQGTSEWIGVPLSGANEVIDGNLSAPQLTLGVTSSAGKYLDLQTVQTADYEIQISQLDPNSESSVRLWETFSWGINGVSGWVRVPVSSSLVRRQFRVLRRQPGSLVISDPISFQ